MFSRKSAPDKALQIAAKTRCRLNANARHPPSTRADEPHRFSSREVLAAHSVFIVAAHCHLLDLAHETRNCPSFCSCFRGFALVFIAGVDVYLIQGLSAAAKLTSSSIDDAVFDSELTLALYAFPALFGGIGVNLISHVLIRHLGDAERKFEKEHQDA